MVGILMQCHGDLVCVPSVCSIGTGLLHVHIITSFAVNMIRYQLPVNICMQDAAILLKPVLLLVCGTAPMLLMPVSSTPILARPDVVWEIWSLIVLSFRSVDSALCITIIEVVLHLSAQYN